jgi:hypothetical protein
MSGGRGDGERASGRSVGSIYLSIHLSVAQTDPSLFQIETRPPLQHMRRVNELYERSSLASDRLTDRVRVIRSYR